MRLSFAVVLLSLAVPAFAQTQSERTSPPIVTAENDQWYINGDPVQFAGNTYFRAGPVRFFNSNQMVRAGEFLGVPLYVDQTIEPFSLVYVPIGRGLMQAFERPRVGTLAETEGTYPPTFPIAALPLGWTMPMAATAPTSLIPEPYGTRQVRSVGSVGTVGILIPRPTDSRIEVEEVVTPPPPVVRQPPLTAADIQAARRSVTVDYQGKTWVNAGPAIVLEGSGLVQTGESAGFPVYTRGTGAKEDLIYLPVLQGLVTPYRLRP